MFSPSQVNPPDSKKPKHSSPPAPTEASTTEGETAAPDEGTKSVPREANGDGSTTEKADATFQGLQASVVENAQVCHCVVTMSLDTREEGGGEGTGFHHIG